VISVNKGLFADAGIDKGFVIVKVNGVVMHNVEDIHKAVKMANASNEPVLFISGVTPSGRKAYYSVELSK
jgi:S1-C subfamily serine protease